MPNVALRLAKATRLAQFAWFIIFVVLAATSCGSDPTPDGADAASIFPQPYRGTASVQDGRATRSSHYLTMRDGVNIAIDVQLPRDLRGTETIPTILHQTRYWRAVQYRWPLSAFNDEGPRGALGKVAKRFLANGYAWVDVDVRGSGASFGSRPISFSPKEIRDGAEVVEWIIRQPWSNGRVGSLGFSYDGTAAELLLVNQHPAVTAVAPLFSLFDLYAEIAFPGGVHHSWFTNTWSEMNSKLDRNEVPFSGWIAKFFVTGVRPVDHDVEGLLLLRAIREHAANWNPHNEALGITFRNDRPPAPGITRIDKLSPHTYVKRIDASGAAVYSYSGWFDGAYQHAAIRRHLTLTNPANKLIIGPWDHGGRYNISPTSAGPTAFDHAGELLKFLDYHLKDRDNGLLDEPRIHYFTMGEERWKATNRWPPESAMVRYHLAEGHRLTIEMPRSLSGSDEYRIDHTVGTGPESRWHTLIGQPIRDPYPDRAMQDKKLLLYTSEPVAQNTEVTGHPLATLYISSTAHDGSFFVYLEDVEPSGQVHYVTEGVLRALHRHLSDEPRPYRDVIPYRTFQRKDGKLLVPGEVTELVFDLLPTSYVFKKGHRLRIALAGADKDHFAFVPPTPPTVTYHRTRQYASHIDLPVVNQDSK